MNYKMDFSQYELEEKLSRCHTFRQNNLGTVEIKKMNQKWRITLIRGMGNRHAVNIKWDCWIKDYELIVKRKMTFDQIIQMMLAVIVSAVAVLLIVGCFWRLIDSAVFNPRILIGTGVYILFVMILWIVFYMNFYKGINKLLEQIVKMVSMDSGVFCEGVDM